MIEGRKKYSEYSVINVVCIGSECDWVLGEEHSSAKWRSEKENMYT